MGRPPYFDRSQVLDSAMKLVAEKGAGRTTIAAIGSQLGAPVGSIYHRYPSRELLLANMWLELVELFQPGFLGPLLDPELDPSDAAEGAIRFIAAWIAQYPMQSRVLLLHRREDLLVDGWPAQVRERAARLERDAARALRAFARRCRGGCSSSELRLVRFALVDLPLAAFRPAVEAGCPPTRQEIGLATSAARYVLRGEAAERKGRGAANGDRKRMGAGRPR